MGALLQRQSHVRWDTAKPTVHIATSYFYERMKDCVQETCTYASLHK